MFSQNCNLNRSCRLGFVCLAGNADPEAPEIGTNNNDRASSCFIPPITSSFRRAQCHCCSSMLSVTYSTSNSSGFCCPERQNFFASAWNEMGPGAVYSVQARLRAAWFLAPLSPRRPFSSRTYGCQNRHGHEKGSRLSAFFERVVKLLINSRDLGIFSAI